MLRDYQKKAVESCIEWIEDDRGDGIAILPTAAGKSFIVAALADHYGKALVLQPSKELLEQNLQKYEMYNDNAGVWSASAGRKDVGMVTFATIGSIKDASMFKDVKIIIVDEAHLYPTDNSMFSRLTEQLNVKIIGLTATPFRLERSVMGSRLYMLASRKYSWKGYAHVMQVEEVLPWWSKINYRTEYQDLSKLMINAQGSEYTEKSVVQYAKTLDKQIEEALESVADQQSLVFVPSVEQALKLAKKFDGYVVSAYTDKKERAETIRAFKNMEIQRVFNVDVLGVGFDHPALEVLIDANPTLSLGRYSQRIGRLTRPFGDVEKTYIDLSGNSLRFGKIENIVFKQVKRSLHCFSNDRQLTGVNLQDLHIMPPNVEAEFIFPYGKHKGKKLSDIPTGYLEWCSENFTDHGIVSRINKELGKRITW